jgi:hypothetical protein
MRDRASAAGSCTPQCATRAADAASSAIAVIPDRESQLELDDAQMPTPAF